MAVMMGKAMVMAGGGLGSCEMRPSCGLLSSSSRISPVRSVGVGGKRLLCGPRHFSSAGRGRVGASNAAVFASIAVNATSPPITLHVGETSFTLPFSAEAAKGLNSAIDGLFLTFKEREKASRPQRWKNMEFRHTGEDGVFFEVFCNPNAYSNAFQAKVLITINDEKIKIASEGQLSALKADIDEYAVQHI